MDDSMMKKANRYSAIIEKIFESRYSPGAKSVSFKRDDLIRTADELGIKLPNNLGDLIYSFRYRAALPDSILKHAPEDSTWVIRLKGQGKYQFSLTRASRIIPNSMLAETKIPDATPGIIAKHAINDEQGLLARLRYNRLIDIFTGVACYSLQNHLRTTVDDLGQIETDEVYVGVDKRGAQYVFPVQAKSGSDQLGIVQVEQDIALCEAKFPKLICRPIAAQFVEEGKIALFAFEQDQEGEIAISDERHYRLVPHEQMTDDELDKYRNRTPNQTKIQ